ncbi:MAG TPA: protein kinase, partial [Candidatus Berkiella sp.]|nr:protein kinase [Candidatus Berkiella sp.]
MKNKLKILPQWVLCESSGQNQLQVFTAAPSFQRRPQPVERSVEDKICKQLVVAQYIATAQLAVIRSRETGQTVPLHLTLVGQSAFNNNPSVMKEAMAKVAEIVKGENVAIYVHAYTPKDVALIETQMKDNIDKLYEVKKINKEQFKNIPRPAVAVKDKTRVKKAVKNAFARLSAKNFEKISSNSRSVSEPQAPNGRARKALPSEWLLPINKKEFDDAVAQLKNAENGAKLSKKESKLPCSFIKINGEVYAMANGEYLGEGAYGKVKVVQDSSGRNFAIKIEGKGTYAEQGAEQNIASAIGYLKGKATRALSDEKLFKENEIKEKVYTVVELRKGKEIFQHLYSTSLKPGQLYEDKDLQRNEITLTQAQKLILAYKSCERLKDLHGRGIIHGDLKPANFMADINENHIVVGAIDFGFSFRLDKSVNQSRIIHDGAPNGTPLKYMPPEVKRAHSSVQNRQPAEFS